MKRFFLLLFLISYAMAFTAPFVFAGTTTTDDGNDATWTSDGLCGGGEDAYEFDSSSTIASEDEAYQAYMADYEKAHSDLYDSTGDFCGKTNEFTGLFEKGDCTASGQIVTEITEPIAPNVQLDANTKVITVYMGTCCLAYYANPDDANTLYCTETRTIYSDSYATCKENGVGCTERQWLIAKSGVGLLKLFVKQIYTFGAITIGFLAVAGIVYNGIKISASGVSGDVSDAKGKIIQAISGLVLLFVSSLILYTINPDFFG